jgi:molybdenum cofactor cytidylyltransferase
MTLETSPKFVPAAVVLAAGTSSRMGQPKQLMQWGEKPMVRHIVETLIAGGVEPGGVVVVVGHRRDEVEAALAGLPVVFAFNPDYADGSMLRSLQVGVRLLESAPAHYDAVLIALSDQPQITASITRKVIEHWRATEAWVVAPSFGRRRGHPILFARHTWPDILNAPPIGSPRDILDKLADKVVYVEAPDDAVLRDIDTPEDYRRELERRV